METLQGMKRDHHCGELRKENVGTDVVLCGWVARRRDHGGLIFVDMRDRSGFVQVVFDEASMEGGTFHKAESLRNEFCIAVRGTVRARSEETVNSNIETGEIEVVCTELRILNKAKTPPFYIQDGIDVDEMLRLKYRYLDLRRPEMQKNIILRHRVTKIMRDYFDRNGFLEIETPMLCKSTPEGARDFLVPSRVNPGEFYALPQSPQIFKQILQVAGFEKYFQIVRCFRDEDLRADRQPEFTQLDIEMSFKSQEEILTIMEEMIKELFEKSIGAKVETPFERMDWDTAMDKYGSDKPDLRFDMPLMDISEFVKGSDFKVFNAVIENGGMVKCIKVDGKLNVTGGVIEATTTGGTYKYGNADSQPKAIKSDGNMTISGGTIKATVSGHEAIETKGEMTITDGYVYAFSSSDDAINASSHMYLKGGTVIGVSNGNDGIDTNGNMYISDGTIIACGAGQPECGLDAAERYNLYITGGTVLGVGGGNNTVTFTNGSQCVLGTSGSATAGTEVTVKSGSTVLATFTIPDGYSPTSGGFGGGGPGGMGGGFGGFGGFGGGPGGFGGNQGNGSFSYLLSCPGLTSGSSYTVTIGTTSSTCKAATSYAGR